MTDPITPDYEALFDQSPSLTVTVDRRGVIESINVHGASEMGYGKSELVGLSVFALVAEGDQPTLEEQIEAARNSPDGVASRDLRLLRKDGSTLWARGSLRSIPQSEAEERFLLVCKDLTEHKTTEQRLLDYRKRLQVLTSQLVLAEERERRRISTLLHDDVGHSLALAQIRLGKLEHEGTTDLRVALAPVRELIAEAIETTRSLTFELSSPVLYELGLEAALQSVMDRLAEATGIRFDFVSDGEPRQLSEDKRVLLYRSVREFLLNAAKHARAELVTVSVQTVGGDMEIRVTDDGVGFDAEDAMRPEGKGIGHGLLSALEQLQSIGASLQVDAEPGKGVSCCVVAPL